MSIFLISSVPEKVPQEYIKDNMYEDRFFLPGTIHGSEDYLILAYLKDAHCETDSDNDQFEVHYITADLIREAEEKFSASHEDFMSYLYEHSESFGCPNDGTGGNFAELVRNWDKSVYMSTQALAAWAAGTVSSHKAESSRRSEVK